MSATQRLFFGLPLSRPDREKLAGLQAALRLKAPTRTHLRWLGADSLHLTLKFLGQVEGNQFQEIDALLARCAAGVPRIDCATHQATAFPSLHAASVVVVQLSDPSGWLERLSARLESAAAEHGFARDARSFVPHITVARLPNPSDARTWIQPFSAPPIALTFDEVRLYRSELTPTGSRYHTLRAMPLGAPSLSPP